MNLPTEFMKPDLDVLHTNIPSNIDLSKISSIGEFLSAPSRSPVPNSRAAAVGTSPVTALRLNSPTTHHVTTDQGWITVETVFVQLNTSLTPSGRFPVYRNELSPSLGGPVTVGCDAAVCVKKYEPWIVEAYNTSTGSSFTLRIVEKQNGSTSLLPSGIIQGARIVGTRYLNATGKDFMFSTVYNASVDRVWEVTKNQGNKSTPRYSPTPTVGPTVPPCTTSFLTRPITQIVSFTEGTGLRGYVELSPDRFAVFRARSDAVNVLPYLVGSGPVVAQFYKDETLAYTAYKPWQMVALLVLVLTLGTIGELFVPVLPLNIPRRGFGLYSWLALFKSRARGLGRVPCISANQMSIFRSCNLRRPTTSVSLRASTNWRKVFQISGSSSWCRNQRCRSGGSTRWHFLSLSSLSCVELGVHEPPDM